ncbi:hypothetical protein S40285_06312 [Stachybotrys chlorohalonatus IBT 40285]|uniref:DUF6546 domain-containing protein n=1 Tax=Stachybotrys chlorohalonatus (strain IBT 40285) TaxID=1283841 RepID=A0A084Q9Y8_STAC4|nr:hypothetical protein S40285_06312 [Stachybotrys chlorohalonata IBT 40285]
MELWYGARHIASVFRYLVEAGNTTIAWRGTWKFDMRGWPEIEKVWQQVSVFHTTRNLAGILEEALEEGCITSHAEAATRLGIRSMVAHPSSLEEIRREAGRYSTFHLGYLLSQLPLQLQLRLRFHLYHLRGQEQQQQ